MNPVLEKFARDTLKNDLALLPDDWQHRFKQMYAGGKLDKDINDVVDAMDTDRLDRAMEQVQYSLNQKGEKW